MSLKNQLPPKNYPAAPPAPVVRQTAFTGPPRLDVRRPATTPAHPDFPELRQLSRTPRLGEDNSRDVVTLLFNDLGAGMIGRLAVSGAVQDLSHGISGGGQRLGHVADELLKQVLPQNNIASVVAGVNQQELQFAGHSPLRVTNFLIPLTPRQLADQPHLAVVPVAGHPVAALADLTTNTQFGVQDMAAQALRMGSRATTINLPAKADTRAALIRVSKIKPVPQPVANNSRQAIAARQRLAPPAAPARSWRQLVTQTLGLIGRKKPDPAPTAG